jgi:hypothetical protein
MRLYVFAPLPKFVSVEGEPITLSRTRYEVADRDEVIRALDSVPELTRDGEARWSWSLRSKDVLRCLGNITLHIDELELEAHTESRSRELAAIVETASGRWIRRASVTQTDPWTQIEQKRHRGEDLSAESPESDLPEQVVDQARAQFEERYMREWLDTPLPALGNRTPRHAARLKTQRGKVVELLKILDNDLARDALQGRSGFDSSKLWIELGLEEFRS